MTLLGEQLDLPGKVWHRLNFAWIAFFGVMGLLNIWVAYTFTTATWVNFKLFGGLGLMLLFMLLSEAMGLPFGFVSVLPASARSALSLFDDSSGPSFSSNIGLSPESS